MKKGFFLLLLFTMMFFTYSISNNFFNIGDTLQKFNGFNALSYAARQVSFGPRSYKSYAHEQVVDMITMVMKRSKWIVEVQSGRLRDREIVNIVAMNSSNPPTLLIAAHYDSRLFSDQDPDVEKSMSAVPGANDGASGVAVLLELGRILRSIDIPIWIVFFDAEDDGDIQNQDWSMGSTYFVSQMDIIPRAVIVLDMIGDKELEIYKELNSDITLSNEIWEIASELGYSSSFIDKGKYSMVDDHIAFLEIGTPAVLLIDFDYPFWHTTSDTLDKLSADSLQKVGSTIYNWVIYKSPRVE